MKNETKNLLINALFFFSTALWSPHGILMLKYILGGSSIPSYSYFLTLLIFFLGFIPLACGLFISEYYGDKNHVTNNQ
jgi:hypothetical protein